MYKLKEVVIETTKRCNLACVHCGSDCGSKAEEDELSAEEWQRTLKELAAMKVEKIVFSGGEPTLKKGFERILLFAAGLKLKIGFISNGLQRFSNSLLNAISQVKPFAVGLSIDGLKDTHNKIRNNKNSWKGLMKNISLLQEISVQTCAVTTLHKLNYPELPRLASFLDLAGIDSWQIQLVMPSGRMRERSDLLIDEDDFKKICREILSLRNYYSDINIQSADCFGLAPEDLIRSKSFIGCAAGISSMGIDACGNAIPCLSLQGSERRENIRKKSIAAIWQNSTIFDFNRKFDVKKVKGDCEKCDFLSKCRGGCASQSFSYYGRFHSSPFCFARSFCK